MMLIVSARGIRLNACFKGLKGFNEIYKDTTSMSCSMSWSNITLGNEDDFDKVDVSEVI